MFTRFFCFFLHVVCLCVFCQVFKFLLAFLQPNLNLFSHVFIYPWTLANHHLAQPATVAVPQTLAIS